MQYLCLAAFVRFFSVWLFTTASFLADLLFALHSIYSDGLLCFFVSAFKQHTFTLDYISLR